MSSLLDQAKQEFNSGQMAKAAATLQSLLQADPRHVEAMLLLGMVFEQQGDIATAAEVFLHAFDLSATQKKDIGFRAATHFLALGNSAKALEILRKLFALIPDDKDVIHSICGLLRDAGQYNEAAPYAEKLVLLADNFDAWLNAGIVLSGLGRVEQALPLLAKAHAARPDDRLALSEYFWCAASLCDFATSDTLQAKLVAAYAKEGDTPDIRESAFRALMWSGDEAYLARAGLRTAKGLFGFHAQAAKPNPRTTRRPGRVRIAYVSNDFYDHATMSLLAGVLEAHDREVFEIFAFCHTEQQNRKGQMRQRFLQACEHMIDVLDVPDDLVVQAVRELDIDILVDLKGFTQGSRLGIFAAKAAPVQVTWLGFPGTVQGAGLDYAITDWFVTPEGSDAFFEEKLLRMPGSYQCNDGAREPVTRSGQRSEHGLPDGAIVFSSFNQAVKIRTPIFQAWMQILKQVANSVLWIGQLNATAQANLRKAAIAAGMDPSRLIFANTVPMADHLRRLPQADIALDTAPCNGHTTTSDALWAGLPVVTLKGTSFAGRVSESLLNAVGLPDLVAGDIAQYVARTIKLGSHPEEVTKIKSALLSARTTSPLFDSKAFCRDLENLFLSVMPK